MALLGYGLPWTGNKDIQFGQRNQPEELARFDTSIVTMKSLIFFFVIHMTSKIYYIVVI